MLSTVIIAKDRSVILPQCLKTAHRVSDDVVVITNNDHKFINYSQQKNYAVSLAKHDWILSLDADEVLSPNLISEIKKLNLANAEWQMPNAYAIPRRNIIFGKIIRRTNWDPNPIIRLYNRKFGHWAGVVHEQITTSGPLGRLKNPIVHHNYSSVEEFIQKMNHYTSLETTTTNPFCDFLRRYFWHAGFLDGWHGLFLSYLMMIYHTATWVKRKSS